MIHKVGFKLIYRWNFLNQVEQIFYLYSSTRPVGVERS